jgi:hypothetical protein
VFDSIYSTHQHYENHEDLTTLIDELTAEMKKQERKAAQILIQTIDAKPIGSYVAG